MNTTQLLTVATAEEHAAICALREHTRSATCKATLSKSGVPIIDLRCTACLTLADDHRYKAGRTRGILDTLAILPSD